MEPYVQYQRGKINPRVKNKPTQNTADCSVLPLGQVEVQKDIILCNMLGQSQALPKESLCSGDRSTPLLHPAGLEHGKIPGWQLRLAALRLWGLR